MHGNIPPVYEAPKPVYAEELNGNGPASEAFQPAEEQIDSSNLFNQDQEEFIRAFAFNER